MDLKELEKQDIIRKVTFLGGSIHVLHCLKCGHVGKIRNIKKLPEVCSKCKCDPYSPRGKLGRPKK